MNIRVNRLFLLAVLCTSVLTLSFTGAAYPGEDEEDAHDDAARRVFVNCDRGQSLRRAVRRVGPGGTIFVKGTCHDTVTLAMDGITLNGMGSAVIVGDQKPSDDLRGVITVDAARNVTIKGVTVKGGVYGIVGKRGAVFNVGNCTVQDNAQDGIVAILNSTLGLANCSVFGNGDDGIAVTQASSAVFRGNIVSRDNVDDGIVIADASTADVSRATITASGNGDSGLISGDDAVVITGSRGNAGTIIADDNGGDGVFLFNAVTLEATGGGTVRAENNARSGMRLIGNAVIVNGAGNARFVLRDNPIGLLLDVQSGAFFIGGLMVQDNETGVSASGADTVTVVSLQQNPSVIRDNERDVELTFGTRATFENVEIGSISCDETVLSRGTTTCP